MPILEMAFRQRERTILRAWTPQQPELLTAIYGGTVYTKTMPKVTADYNKAITAYDPVPFGFHFDTPPSPQWVALTPLGGINTEPVSQALVSGIIPPLDLTGTALINQPGTITPQQQAVLTQGVNAPPAPVLRVIPFIVTPGLSSVPLQNTSILCRRVTVLAGSANTGTIWIVSARGMASGNGFPLAAGAAKDIGHDTLETVKLDLSQVYIVAENATDKVYCEAEA